MTVMYWFSLLGFQINEIGFQWADQNKFSGGGGGFKDNFVFHGGPACFWVSYCVNFVI